MEESWREKIREAGLTQERVAILSGINGACLSQVCRGLVQILDLKSIIAKWKHRGYHGPDPHGMRHVE